MKVKSTQAAAEPYNCKTPFWECASLKHPLSCINFHHMHTKYFNYHYRKKKVLTEEVHSRMYGSELELKNRAMLMNALVVRQPKGEGVRSQVWSQVSGLKLVCTSGHILFHTLPPSCNHTHPLYPVHTLISSMPL